MNEHVSTWTSEWPTKDGWYWFYGRKYGEEKHSFGTVRVRKISNGIMRVLDGQFMWKAEGHIGFFQPLDFPPIPDDTLEGKDD